MSVQSLAFLAFLTVTVCVCRLLPKERIWVLLAASLVFYLWDGAPAALWGCGLLAVSSFASYLAANTLRKHRRKSVLLAVVCYHIAVLGIFKYTGFFTGGAVRMPFVPLGISFFTFQQIWYLREVYAGTFSQVPTPAEYLTYSFFFPTVSSGPILKPENFFPQLREASPLPQDTAAGLYAIGLGLAKKVLLADNLGVLVNNGWGSLSELTALTAWCVILGYTLQLYFDFSGYCDLAAGCARLLGLRLPINFDSPYRSLSVTEFWKRWHMTLTAFLRENVYFPLGGSRKGRGCTYLNILVVYLVSGIWHGAGWTFILWGLLHGLAQVLERLWGKRRDALPRWARWAMTFLFINLAWIFFRAPDVSSALLLLKTAVTGGMGGIRLWLVNGLFRREVSALELLLPVIGPYTAYLRVALILGIGLLADAAKNLAVAASWAERYPEVEFDFYFSPYSILYWDKIGRMGETDAVFAALELACETLLPYENVTLHGLLFDRDIIEHLDYYCDYVHHSDEAGALALEKIHSGTDRLTEKNYRETLANWHDFVVNYDYDKFWDDYYWYQFHTPAGAKT